ncbi:unnamed protein product, partial [Phaeothamnion confervicola]
MRSRWRWPMWISDLSIKRPVFAVMLIGALVALGLVAITRIGYDLFPSVEFPFVSIATTLEGAAPETMETEVTDIIEEQVNTISSIKSIRSQSFEGRSSIAVEFELSENIDVKAQDVRDKVALTARNLPRDVDPPVVSKVDPDAQPIMSVMVAGDLPIRDITQFADTVVKEQIQRLPGVGSVTLVGGRDREVRIWLDADKMRAYQLTADDVIRAVQNEHAQLPGGQLQTTGNEEEFGVKTMGEVRSIPEFGEIVVAFRNGAPTRVRDVARVEDGMEDERTFAELNGQPGVSLEVRRQSGENTLDVAKAVKASLVDVQKLVPEGLKIVVARDISTFIEGSIHDVTKDMLIGLGLVVLVTLVFLLSSRATIIVAITMPASIIATFFAFYVAGFTLNMLTMMALSVAIGLVVDDAIVVLEAIYRAIDDGYKPMEAASVGIKRVGGAVIAGTNSMLVVFVPIAFMEGIAGRFFFQYGLAVVFSIAVSLLVSLTLTPSLCARFLKPHSSFGPVARWFEARHEAVERIYGRVLGFALGNRWVIVLLAVVTIFGGVIVTRMVPTEFSGKTDRSEFLASVEIPYGSGIEETKRIANRIAAEIRDIPNVTNTFVTIGADQQARINKADFYVSLTPKHERKESFLDIMQKTRVVMQGIPELRKFSISEVPWISGANSQDFDIDYVVRGSSLAELEKFTSKVMQEMRQSGQFLDVQSSFETGKPEIQVGIDRQRSADQGVSVRSVASTVRALVGGVDVATYEEGGLRYDVRMRLEEGQRDDLDKLEQIQVRSAGGGLVDLPNVATLKVNTAPAQINRKDRVRAIDIYGTSAIGVPLSVSTSKVDEIIAKVGMPDGYSGSHEGKSRRMRDSSDAIKFAFMVAIVALYMVLGSQFNSFAQPLVIMLTAPLSFLGAFVALYLSGESLTMFAQIGLIGLMGVVMKNGILLIDLANKLREDEGASARDAIHRAGPQRLRPVLMTAFAMIFGMVPLAVSTSQGSEFRTGLGFLLMGGMISSTLLTFVVVPVAYTLLDDLQRYTRKALVFLRLRKP